MHDTFSPRLSYWVMVIFVVIGAGCAYSPTRQVGYGGEKWSVADIFPAGLHRELAAAAAGGDLPGIDRALKAGAEINYQGANGFTPLWWAAWDKNLRGFSHLLERGADPNIVPAQGRPVMNMIAEEIWPTAFLKAALAHGGNPNLAAKNGRHVLSVAMQQGTREHMDLLLAAGASVNQLPGESEGGPIFAAVMGGRFDYVLLLLEKGADPAAKDGRGRDLAGYIGMFPYAPNSQPYIWRERVIRFLQSKGIEARPPLNEGTPRTPLPSQK